VAYCCHRFPTAEPDGIPPDLHLNYATALDPSLRLAGRVSSLGRCRAARTGSAVHARRAHTAGHDHCPKTVILGVSRRQCESRGEAVILPQRSVATMNSTPRERLQVAEAPESAFSYPVAPNPTLTGKVSLKACVEATIVTTFMCRTHLAHRRCDSSCFSDPTW
jgi:hypothetical protein